MARLAVGRGANDSGGYDFFQGVMAEVRLWGEARSDEQIQALLYRRLNGQERSLAGYWPLDEGTGLVAHDRRTPIDESSGQRLPVTPRDGAIAQERWVPAEDLPLRALAPGVEAAAVVVADLRVDGSGLEAPNVPALAIANSLTVEAWVQVPDTTQGGEASPVVSMFSGSKGWELRWGGGQCTFVAVINNTTYEVASGNLAAGAWLHAAATFDGRQLALYVNGVRKGIRSANGAITIYPGALGIGCSTYRANAGLRGRLAEVRVWNRACSQGEIQQWLFRRRTGSESGLVGLWPLEGDGTAANGELSARPRRGVAWMGAGIPLPDSPERVRVRPPRPPATGTVQGTAQPPGGTGQGTAGAQDNLQRQMAELAREVARLEAANQALRQDRARQASELEAARRELEKEKRQGAPGSGTGSGTGSGAGSGAGSGPGEGTSGGTQLTSLQDFVQNANESIKRAREELRRQGGSYSLERVSLEVKMIPGPRGEGMYFPRLEDLTGAPESGPEVSGGRVSGTPARGERLDPNHLSVLRLDFAAGEPQEKPQIPESTVPSVIGYTEIMARRKLADAGFQITRDFQAVVEKPSEPIQADRVVAQMPREGEKWPLGGAVTIFIGREAVDTTVGV